MTWVSESVPVLAPMRARDWLRALRRGVPLAALLSAGLALLLAIRVVERPLCGRSRPVTPYITQGVCRAALALIGMDVRVVGHPMRHSGAAVANHSSWLDIFALNARKRVYFVAKAEVAGWPGIGWLARATGTVFIARDRAKAAEQLQLFRDRLAAGHRLVFFPEGTSTDGRRVLAFKPTLFAAFASGQGLHDMWLQPVSVIYDAPPGADPRFYGWWGSMALAPHLLAVLAAPRQGTVTVRYHPPVPTAGLADRKALAARTEAAVRQGLDEAGVLDD